MKTIPWDLQFHNNLIWKYRSHHIFMLILWGFADMSGAKITIIKHHTVVPVILFHVIQETSYTRRHTHVILNSICSNRYRQTALYPRVISTIGVPMYQPNIPVVQPCPVIPSGSTPIAGRSVPYLPVYHCRNPIATTPSFEPLNNSGLI